MNTKRNKLSSWIAALAVGSAMIGTSAAVDAAGPQQWDVCPAIDTVPLCEIPRQPSRSGSAGTEVAHVPVDADSTADSSGHDNEAGKANERVDSSSNCLRVPRTQIVACPD
jgi:hypothetical protein